MDKLKGKVTVELTVDEWLRINQLIDRDREKPMVEYKFDTTNGGMALCPSCGRVINTNFRFCGFCGQRIDIENYAL